MSSRGSAVCSLSTVFCLSATPGRSLRNRYSRFLCESVAFHYHSIQIFVCYSVLFWPPQTVSPESVQGNDAFVSHIAARHQLHHVHALLQILDGAQPLQARVLDVDALVELDLLQMFQTI